MKARGDASTPPISDLMKPMYVLQMNWWHLSDEMRLKWLGEMEKALKTTLSKVRFEMQRLRGQIERAR